MNHIQSFCLANNELHTSVPLYIFQRLKELDSHRRIWQIILADILRIYSPFLSALGFSFGNTPLPHCATGVNFRWADCTQPQPTLFYPHLKWRLVQQGFSSTPRQTSIWFLPGCSDWPDQSKSQDFFLMLIESDSLPPRGYEPSDVWPWSLLAAILWIWWNPAYGRSRNTEEDTAQSHRKTTECLPQNTPGLLRDMSR